MPTTEHRIDGSLLVLNLDKNGASVVIPKQPGRARFETLKARRDRVSLIDVEGNEYVLEAASPVDAEFAASLGGIIVHEMNTEDQDDFIEYAIRTDVDLSTEADNDSVGPAP